MDRHTTPDGTRMVQGRHCAARTSSSCLSVAYLRVPFPHGLYADPRGTPLFLPRHPQMTYLPRFVPGEWLSQECFNALDYNCYGVLQPKEVEHTQHLTIQDFGVLVRGGPSIVTEEPVAPTIELSPASTRHRIDLLFPADATQINFPTACTAILRMNRRCRKRLVLGPTSALPSPLPTVRCIPPCPLARLL